MHLYICGLEWSGIKILGPEIQCLNGVFDYFWEWGVAIFSQRGRGENAIGQKDGI
jgi:hypothetical protein